MRELGEVLVQGCKMLKLHINSSIKHCNVNVSHWDLLSTEQEGRKGA